MCSVILRRRGPASMLKTKAIASALGQQCDEECTSALFFTTAGALLASPDSDVKLARTNAALAASMWACYEGREWVAVECEQGVLVVRSAAADMLVAVLGKQVAALLPRAQALAEFFARELSMEE